MKKVPVQEAIGMVLCHDITKIVPGEFKGPAFKKGHIIREEDIPELLKLGKDHIYVWEVKEGILHENEAAQRIARAVGGDRFIFTEPKEGKVNLLVKERGLFKVDREALFEINMLGELMVSTLHTNRVVGPGQYVAGTRIIPLVIEEEKIKKVEEICRDKKVLEVKPLAQPKVGVVNTGNEIFYGRIEDKFTPVLAEKLKAFGLTIDMHLKAPDDVEKIAEAILKLKEAGMELILATGGMSVDPDDLTPGGIKRAGGEVVVYGSPVLPGAMFLYALLDGVPVLGLPGCVMYSKTTIFDLVLPRILAGEVLTRKDIAALGHGGLCLECPVCTYPHCPFGK
ncbi:molybdopterin-binding protein [Carboxydothermus hydrogenoformans]|uniref:Molybdopterin molybdenumtransferase n=1 Tax=Carboxydothermus hydrogenoformans (strain ATCC BAA-161 / DSM 6008 / Z-2901) TaxID=246194 RepID=Q3AEF7_CARHZ|nr:molybdopterin-binding protein [Carboxydothermus hydrogenoformans]ABB15537.1 molybdopterin-binding domain protein [Carboxydothermus hydrogenoformans Z-2901]